MGPRYSFVTWVLGIFTVSLIALIVSRLRRQYLPPLSSLLGGDVTISALRDQLENSIEELDTACQEGTITECFRDEVGDYSERWLQDLVEEERAGICHRMYLALLALAWEAYAPDHPAVTVKYAESVLDGTDSEIILEQALKYAGGLTSESGHYTCSTSTQRAHA